MLRRRVLELDSPLCALVLEDRLAHLVSYLRGSYPDQKRSDSWDESDCVLRELLDERVVPFFLLQPGLRSVWAKSRVPRVSGVRAPKLARREWLRKRSVLKSAHHAIEHGSKRFLLSMSAHHRLLNAGMTHVEHFRPSFCNQRLVMLAERNTCRELGEQLRLLLDGLDEPFQLLLALVQAALVLASDLLVVVGAVVLLLDACAQERDMLFDKRHPSKDPRDIVCLLPRRLERS
jgi:hypothetical protein